MVYDNPNKDILGELMSKGVIRCSGCDTVMPRGRSCPKCGRVRAYVWIYWQGQTHRYRTDIDGAAMSYLQAANLLIQINQKITAGNFDPKEFLPAYSEARKFKNGLS